jgi:prolyl-tRNA synthetase
MNLTSLEPQYSTFGLRQSKLLTKTLREVSKEEISVNARLLEQAGFIHKLMSGVYSLLPLGLRVLNKVENIVRAEMSNISSQELLMPVLQPKENWITTGRWDTVDILFKLKGAGDRDLALGATHEEIITPIIGQYIQSHKDLPYSVFQIQTKFRNEVRAKSGLLRGREFRMKDMYSFHATEKDLDDYYNLAIAAYNRIFARCGLGENTYLTYSSGGIFSKYSHEFQTLTPYGEDIIYVDDDTKIAINREIFEEVKNDPEWKDRRFTEQKAIEVGNIFKLGSRFTDAFGLSYTDFDSSQQPILMGCYGIGTTRLLGTIVEKMNDAEGIVWPKNIAPYCIHLISLFNNVTSSTVPDELFEMLIKCGIEVLYDDRDLNAGIKFKDCDLMGLPYRIVVSPRGLENSELEVKVRESGKITKLSLGEFKNALENRNLLKLLNERLFS